MAAPSRAAAAAPSSLGEASLDGWNIVVLGHWDPLILTPRWVGEHLASGEVNVELPAHARLPPRLNFDGVATLVVEGRLVVAPHKADRPGLAAAEKMVVRLLELLPHTPVNGLGVNFQWLLPRSGKVADALRPADEAAVASAGYEVAQVTLRRRLTSKEHVVNLSVESADDGKARVSANFHVDASSGGEARAGVEGKTASLLTAAEALLQKLYA